jgi:hypothetical protein
MRPWAVFSVVSSESCPRETVCPENCVGNCSRKSPSRVWRAFLFVAQQPFEGGGGGGEVERDRNGTGER